MAISRTRDIELTVDVPSHVILAALSEDDIRNEFNRRELADHGAIERAEFERLGRLIAAGETQDALDLLKDIAPPNVQLLAPRTQMRLEALYREPAHVQS